MCVGRDGMRQRDMGIYGPRSKSLAWEAKDCRLVDAGTVWLGKQQRSVRARRGTVFELNRGAAQRVRPLIKYVGR